MREKIKELKDEKKKVIVIHSDKGEASEYINELVEMNISQDEWCALYDEFETLSDNSKMDIMKYIYLNFAMAKMIKYKKEENIKF